MRVNLSCGGTGGHIMPALAIARIVKEKDPHAQILFVGSEGGMERELVGREGYEIRLLCVQGLPRKPSPKAVRALFRAGVALREAARIIEDFSPDIVIGTGGFASYPALRAAAFRKIPTAVHESNAVPGLAVKLLSPRVDRVWLNMEAAGQGIRQKEKLCVVGNPLRRACYLSKDAPIKSSPPYRVLSFGGSLGADLLNTAVLAMMERERADSHIYHLHATGKKGYEACLKEFRARGLDRCHRLSLVPFIDDMPREMARADLVICRAGAMTLSELAAMGKPSILIPSPNVTGNHQYENARALFLAGAAKMLTEEAVFDELFTTVKALLGSPKERAEMSRQIRNFAHADANERIWGEISCLTAKKDR